MMGCGGEGVAVGGGAGALAGGGVSETLFIGC